jgi:hypothetical protein
LETGECQDPLSSALGHDAREPGERSDVGELVEGEQEAGSLVVAVVGGVDQFLDEPDDEWDANRLVAAWGDHVELMGTRQKLGDIEWCLASRRPSRLGADAGEEPRGRRPDARTFALFGRENSLEQWHGRMMFAVSFGEFVKKIIATSLVDARRQLSDCLIA